MKYIFLILICFLSLTGFSQAIVNRSGPTQTVQDARWKALMNLYIPLYLDTTAASAAKGIDSTGALVYTYSDQSLWYRVCCPKHWVKVGTGGSGSGQLFAVGDSTATGTRYFNQKKNAFIYDSAGSHIIVAYDTFNHYFTKFYLDTTYTYLQVSSNDFNTFGSISVTKGNATMSASSPDSGHQVVVNNGNVTIRDLKNNPTKLVVTGINNGTDTVFAPTRILVLQGDTVKSARYPSLSPTDTANLSYRIDTVGKIIYIDTTQYLRYNITDSILYSIPVNGVFANGLISIGGINLLDSTLTILPNIVFVRNDTTYTLTSSASFIIHSTALNKYRSDLIYVDSNNVLQHLVGIEDTVITVPPPVPYKGIGIAVVNVHNGVINSTIIPTNNNWVTDGTNSFPLGTDGILGTATASNLRTVIGGVNRSIYPATGGFALYGIGTTQMNAIPTPLAGTIVYNNDSLAYCYYNGSIWQKMGSGSGGGGGTITHAVDSLYTLNDSLLLVHYSPYNRTDTFSWRGSGGSSGVSKYTTNGLDILVDSTSSLYTIKADTSVSGLSGKYLRRIDTTGNLGYVPIWRLNNIKDSTAYHSVSIYQDTLLIICDLQGRCDTVGMASVNYWGLKDTSVYRLTGNVIIGADTTSSRLAVFKDDLGTSSNYMTGVGLLLKNKTVSTSLRGQQSPLLKIESYSFAGSSNNKYTYTIGLNTSGGMEIRGYFNDVFQSSTTNSFGTWGINTLNVAGVSTLTGGISTANISSSGTITAVAISTSGRSAFTTSSTGNATSVGVAAATIDTASMFAVTSTNRGALLPVMTQAQRDSINLKITSIVIDNGGTGYTIAPTSVSVTGTNQIYLATFGTVTIAAGAVTSVPVTNGGSYFRTPAVTLNGGNGSGALVHAVMTQSLPVGMQVFCSNCTATDTSTGVQQFWNGTTWKNAW